MSEQDLLNALVGGVCMGVEEECVRELLDKLPVRQRDVLSRIFEVGREQETLKEISSTYSVSAERIRQIEAKALVQLRLLLFEDYDVAFTGTVLVSKQGIKRREAILPTLSEEDAKWLAGFCEGDGCVAMNKQKRSFVALAQKEPDVLEYVESILPGGVWHFRKKVLIWTLSYNRKELREVLLRTIAEHVVGLRTLRRLNDVFTAEGIAVTSTHEPSIGWLAGFFDADGGVNWNTPSGGIHIGQKDRSVLDAIQRYFGGSVNQTKPNFFEWYAGKRKSDLKDLANKLYRRSHKFSIREALTSLLTRLYVEEHHIQ